MKYKNLKVKTSALLLVVALAGCQTTHNKNIPTDVKISIYNDIKSGYSYRPTFATVSEDYLQIRAMNWKGEKIFTNVTRETANETVKVIEKYQSWNKKAKENQHIIEKQIAQVGHFTYTFFSGNENKHFLVSQVCAICESVYLDEENADKWKQQIIDWKSGKINTNDVSSQYN